MFINDLLVLFKKIYKKIKICLKLFVLYKLFYLSLNKFKFNLVSNASAYHFHKSNSKIQVRGVFFFYLN